MEQWRSLPPSKRSTTRRYIETSVFVDQSMVTFYGVRLESYVHTIVNIVSTFH